MSETYLLDCNCGKRAPVTPSQAGGEVRCACGARLDVPPLRALRRLPLGEATADVRPAAWTGKQRLWVIGSLLIVAGAMLGGFTRWNRPPPPDEAVKAEILENAELVRQQAPRLDVSEARQVFAALSTTPLRTLDEVVEFHPYNAKYADLLAENENWMLVAWGLVGLGIVIVATSHVMATLAPGHQGGGRIRKGGRASR